MATAAPKERVTNPLEIAEVLEHVLNYVPLGDLKSAREVAKLWRDESLDNFRKGIVYVLDPATESKRFLRLSLNIATTADGSSFHSSSPTGIYQFQDKPFKKYRLIGEQEITPNGVHSLGLAPMDYFWNQCGPHLTYLDLKGPAYLFESSFVDALISFFKLCPNLEELKFSPVWIRDADIYRENKDGNQNGIFDEVFILQEISELMYNIRRISKTQLAKMQECLALKIKSLSIELAGIYRHMPTLVDEYYERNFYSRLWRCVFNLMPNLKKLSLDGDGDQYFYALDALLHKTLTTNQLIQLDSFEYNCEKPGPSDFYFVLAPLRNYLGNFGIVTSPVPLKDLKLMKIPFRSIWGFPRTFRNILFLIRSRIEALCIGLRCRQGFNPEPPEHCKFDFFNLIFPNLVELALEFDYKSYEYKPRDYNYKPYRHRRNANENFLFFDFAVFRGTPNLKRFQMKTLHVPDRAWLKRKLGAEDLLNGPGQKWYLMDGVGLDQHGMSLEDYWGILPIETDGTETFDPEEEGDGIVLEKMKEFYFTGRFTTEALLVLGKWMKNLKEFAAIFDDETISFPFVIWPGTLKQLTVLKPSFEGEDQVSEKLISDLQEMYPEVKIVLEGQIDIQMDRLALGNETE